MFCLHKGTSLHQLVLSTWGCRSRRSGNNVRGLRNSDIGYDTLGRVPDFDNTKYTVTGEGHLHGQGINYTYDGDDKFGDFTWKNDQFCVGFADMDYDYYSDGEFQLTMFTCSLSAVSSSASVVADNFSSAIFMSVFFFKWCY